MSIIIESTIEKFKGNIYLPDFLTMPQVNAFNAANRKVQKAANSPDGLLMFDRDEMIAPGLFACVERLEVENQPEHPTVDTFRFTPSHGGDMFISLLIVSITNIILGADQVPNA